MIYALLTALIVLGAVLGMLLVLTYEARRLARQRRPLSRRALLVTAKLDRSAIQASAVRQMLDTELQALRGEISEQDRLTILREEEAVLARWRNKEKPYHARS